MTSPRPSGLWPVRCAPVGAVAVGSALWRHRGELRCTAIVKATFGMEPGGLMRRHNPQPIRRSDDYLSGRPSLAGAAEVVPFAPQPELVLVGRAHAHGGPVKKRSVRLSLVRGRQILVDKTLFVYGDESETGTKPFSRMGLGYERALGGLDCPDNPVGTGLEEGTHRPNVLEPADPGGRVGNFGPLPARFPERRRRRGSVSSERIEQGIAEYPDDFDWRYFQTAPRDQRLEHLAGDEWLFVEGMHPEMERLRTRLPHASAYAHLYSRHPGHAPERVALRAELLHVEPEQSRCSLVWRGSFPVTSELAAESIVIAGAVQLDREPIRWPATIEDLERLASPSTSGIAGAREDDLQPTVARPSAAPQQRLGAGYRLEAGRMPLAGEPPGIGATAQPPPSSAGIEPPSGSDAGFDGTVMMLDASDVDVLAPEGDARGPEDEAHPLEQTDEMDDPDCEDGATSR